MLDRLNLVTAGCCASNGSASKNVSHFMSMLDLLSSGGAGRQACNAGGPAGRTAGVARTTARSTFFHANWATSVVTDRAGTSIGPPEAITG